LSNCELVCMYNLCCVCVFYVTVSVFVTVVWWHWKEWELCRIMRLCLQYLPIFCIMSIYEYIKMVISLVSTDAISKTAGTETSSNCVREMYTTELKINFMWHTSMSTSKLRLCVTVFLLTCSLYMCLCLSVNFHDLKKNVRYMQWDETIDCIGELTGIQKSFFTLSLLF